MAKTDHEYDTVEGAVAAVGCWTSAVVLFAVAISVWAWVAAIMWVADRLLEWLAG